MCIRKNIFLIIIFTINSIISQPNDISLEDSNNLFSELHNSKYLWGTYKPNLYFAMKQKQKETAVFGLMWYGIKEKYFSKKVNIDEILRHNCLKTDAIKYYWPYHNGLDYSNEIIKDEENNLKLDINTIKTNYDINEQSWVTKISGQKLKNSIENKNIGIILYFSLEEYELSKKAVFSSENIKIDDANYSIKESKYNEILEKFDVEIISGKEGLKYSDFQKYRKGYQYNWRVKQFIEESLKINQEIHLFHLMKKLKLNNQILLQYKWYFQ